MAAKSRNVFHHHVRNKGGRRYQSIFQESYKYWKVVSLVYASTKYSIFFCFNSLKWARECERYSNPVKDPVLSKSEEWRVESRHLDF